MFVLADYQQQLERVFAEVRDAKTRSRRGEAARIRHRAGLPRRRAPRRHADTAVTREILKRIAEAHVRRPTASRCTRRCCRSCSVAPASITDGPIDWGTGEILAFGSLLMQGRPVRLAGQDSRRGTFVSAGSRPSSTAERPRVDAAERNLTEDQAKFYIYDSLLSEYAALGFEYGYSVARPDALVVWEAQFGDFVNGAQTVIDEFISSGETKWRQQSGVVLLLPHGYEGQGPDHSSARIERWLTMCADEAFVVAQPSTPASYFHLLRQHSLGEGTARWWSSPRSRCSSARRPRRSRRTSPRARSGRSSADANADPEKVDTLLLCSGRITWDLMVGARQARGRRTVRDRPHRAALPAPVDDDPGRARSATPTSRRCAGCRTSRSTWARGRTTSSTCGPTLCPTSPSSRSPARALVAVGRHRQAARRGVEGAARRGVRRRRGPPGRRALLTPVDVLHRSRDRGAPAAPG